MQTTCWWGTITSSFPCCVFSTNCAKFHSEPTQSQWKDQSQQNIRNKFFDHHQYTFWFKIFPLFCVCNEIYCASCWPVEWVYRESIEPPVFGWLGPTSREDGASISYIIYICNQLTGRKKEWFNNYTWMSLLLDPPMMRGNDAWGSRLFIFLLQLTGSFGRKYDLIAGVKI